MDKNLAMKSMRPAANARAQCSETCQLDMLKHSRSFKPHSDWINMNIFVWTVNLQVPLRSCSSLNGFSWVSLDFGNNSYCLFQRDESPSLCAIMCLLVFSVWRRDDSSFTAIWEALSLYMLWCQFHSQVEKAVILSALRYAVGWCVLLGSTFPSQAEAVSPCSMWPNPY